MAAYTLAEAQAKLAALKAAELQAIKGQSYSISVGGNSRNFARQSPEMLQKEIAKISAYISKLQSGHRGMDIKFGTPYDV